MREIQATEAKTRLAELLRAVEHGEAITITRHGKPVAHLVPAGSQDRANTGKSSRNDSAAAVPGGGASTSQRMKYSPRAMKVTAYERTGCRCLYRRSVAL